MINKIDYSEGSFHVISTLGDDLISLHSTSKSTLLDVILSLELAGVAEEKDFNDLSIKETSEGEYKLVIDRATFCMWLGFEVLNY